MDFDVRRGRSGDAARAQRRRQDHHAASRSWAWSARARGLDHGSRAARRSACRRTASRASASRYCPEERGIFSSLDVEENLLLPPQVRDGRPDASSRSTSCFPNLQRAPAAARARKLSGGEQQMLAIGRILRTGARLLLLDEPTEGLAPVIVQQIGRTIARLKERGLHDPAGRAELPLRRDRRRPALRDRARPRRRHDPERRARGEHGQAARVSGV